MKVKFLPQNVEVEVTPAKSLLQIATENNLEIRSICKGVPSCAECRVRIVEGDQNVLPPSKAELNLIGTSYYIDSRRLSCQLRCFGDVTIDLTEQVEKAANQVKKIRGFRSSKQVQSHAVNDTMLLNEKIEVNERPERSEESRTDEKPPQSGQPNQQRQKQQKQQNQNRQQQQAKGGGGQQNQQRQQQQQKAKQQNSNQQPQGQGKQGKPQNQQKGGGGGGGPKPQHQNQPKQQQSQQQNKPKT